MKDKSPAQMRKDLLSYFEGRFGLEPSAFDDFGLYMASRGRVYLGPRRIIDRPRVVTVGLLVARTGGAIKPTTNLLQAFGRRVTKNRVELTRAQAIAYAKGDDLSLEEGQLAGASDGYILLSYESFPLGCGLLKKRSVKNMLPKAKRLELSFI